MAYYKKSQDSYRDKTQPIQFAVQYKSADRPEGERLRAYLAQAGISANSYLKQLIKQDMDRQGIPYPANNPTSDGIDDNNDALPWESDDHSSHATHNSGSAWDIMEQIARENGYKG